MVTTILYPDREIHLILYIPILKKQANVSFYFFGFQEFKKCTNASMPFFESVEITTFGW